VDQPKTVNGFGYTMRFAIERSDLDHIVKSRSLKAVQDVSYAGQSLKWKWDQVSGVSISPYGREWWSHEPMWFSDLTNWNEPEGYALDEKRGNRSITQVLIYSPGLKEAIFITFDVR